MAGNENNVASWYNDPIKRQAMGIQAGDFLPGGVSTMGVWGNVKAPEVGGFDGGGGGGFNLSGEKPPWWREDSLYAGKHNEGTAHLFGNTMMTPGPAPITSPNLNFNSAPASVSLSGPLSSRGMSLNPRTGGAFSGSVGRW